MIATEWLDELEPGTILWRFTVDQYHSMVDREILIEGEPCELLGGFLVRKNRSAHGEDPMTIHPYHVWTVENLQTMARRLKRMGCHLRTQQPITLPPYDEPEPDGAIVAGVAEDFLESHPGAPHVSCVIEVADASLRVDRRVKQRLYAASGIAQYVIINSREWFVEVYTEPLAGAGGRVAKYGLTTILTLKRTVEFFAGGDRLLRVPVRSLLPPLALPSE